jgi:hypothetical protein
MTPGKVVGLPVELLNSIFPIRLLLLSLFLLLTPLGAYFILQNKSCVPLSFD